MDRYIFDAKASTCSYKDWTVNISCGYWTSAEVVNVTTVLWNKSQWFAGFGQTDLSSGPEGPNTTTLQIMEKVGRDLEEPKSLVTVRYLVECCCVLTFRATVDLRAVTQMDWSLVQCWNERKIWCYNSLMNEDDCLYTSCDAVSCDPALLPVDMNTTTTVVFTSSQTHDHNKLLAHLIGWLFPLYLFLSNPEACHRSPLTASLRKTGNTGSLLWYWLCLLQYCWNQHGLTPTLYWPHSLQATVWTLHKFRQQLHSWILQLVVTQVELSQMGGVGVQSWGQRSTTDLWQTAAPQSE